MDQQMASQMFIELITGNMNLKTAAMLWFYEKFIMQNFEIEV